MLKQQGDYNMRLINIALAGAAILTLPFHRSHSSNQRGLVGIGTSLANATTTPVNHDISIPLETAINISQISVKTTPSIVGNETGIEQNTCKTSSNSHEPNKINETEKNATYVNGTKNKPVVPKNDSNAVENAGNATSSTSATDINRTKKINEKSNTAP